MAVVVCVYWGSNPAANPPPAQAEAGVWMDARSSELIFTIMCSKGPATESTVESCQLLCSSCSPLCTAPPAPSALGTSLFSF